MATPTLPESAVATLPEQANPVGRSRWWSVALVAGDALSFLVFAGAGRQQHGETSGLGALGYVAWTAVPFALGWFLVSPWLGAFGRRLFDSPLRMLWRTELAWLCAWPATLILRALIAPDHQMPWTFAAVILIANAVFLGLWRTAFALITRLILRQKSAQG
ncbi:MAG TPA: DUF3054 domain-containing protein [Ktedonobacterales bacterium]|nr:DUF3054 domain-containing protein [Ktedonobacterales bacterium]